MAANSVQDGPYCTAAPAEALQHDQSAASTPPGGPSDQTEAADFSHPAYKQLSLTNGLINKMSKEEIRNKLEQLQLDTRGNKDVMKKRLKLYYKREKLRTVRPRSQKLPLFDYYLVIDFEATCEEYNPDGFRHEIIEFPAILIDAHQNAKVGEFHAYVKPMLNPKLTAFCSKLTGIQQWQVDEAETFPTVLEKMERWMGTYQLNKGEKTLALVTDGPWDMSRFMFLQCQTSKVPLPPWARRWVNLRKTFCNFYRIRRAKLITMLENLGMAFEGKPHCGLDDTRNIARITMHLLKDGATVRINEEMFQTKQEALSHLQANVRPVGAHGEGEMGGEFDERSGGIGSSSHDRGHPSPPSGYTNANSNCNNAGTDNSLSCDSDLVCGICDMSLLDRELAHYNKCNSGPHMHSNCTDCLPGDSAQEDYSDLLAYHALQKS